MLELQVKNIQQKTQQLIRMLVGLKKENGRLRAENEELAKKIETYQANVEQLQEQVDILKISSGNWDDKDKREFEKRIAGYIKEIDKCISLLSR